MKLIFKNLWHLIRRIFGLDTYDDFESRSDARTLWKSKFESSAKDVEDFLEIVDSAFLVPKRYWFRVLPDDSIGALYRRSTAGSYADTLEIENLIYDIEKRFGYSFHCKEILPELTIGKIFSMVTGYES